MACVDCHHVRAADISHDIDPLLLDELVDVRHYFLRRLLGSMTAPCDHSRTPALPHLRMDTGTPAGTFGSTRTRTRKNRTRARVGSKTRTGYPRVPKSVWLQIHASKQKLDEYDMFNESTDDQRANCEQKTEECEEKKPKYTAKKPAGTRVGYAG
ncbi:hypothetical protein DFH08DRAFT_813106 [Mycena albidolilacea]|uniref:Uncharacterized protein n=1 Tax=Mycena albidolilacea TaxID=1033008 RepID=A0AAD6ZSE5_9AGAR|nr:hypothetical protein DFH08DRAFT_813106 [Mycena albidolilacea]